MTNQIILGDCFEVLKTIPKNSIDLILIDPPYLISRNSNFTNYSDKISPELKIKYGNLSIDFGDWDKSELDWNYLFGEYNRILKNGGQLIIFYDIWKSNELKLMADKYKLKQHRVCQWVKTNPVPVNSKLNYLSNAIEYFFCFTKGKNPTFNSEYDKGIYTFPICHGKERTEHPTQKPLELIKSIIKKHTNEDDIVVDTFAGSGTTGVACVELKRKFILIEKEENYFNICNQRIQQTKEKIIY